jgi:hypothetical protein
MTCRDKGIRGDLYVCEELAAYLLFASLAYMSTYNSCSKNYGTNKKRLNSENWKTIHDIK